MNVIDQFIVRYRREQDFFDHAGRLVRDMLEARLQAEGIRAMVTYRAKSVNRLEPKVTERNKTKKYATVDDIYNDIVDLAGTRVALYFPGQRSLVHRLIERDFQVLEEPKTFPDNKPGKYDKRFAGYAATHYRVQLKESSLPDVQKRFAEARVEIQVASVLMHAWSEVEHDLVYKPLQGDLSDDEYRILDQLNGLVMTGELALEQLQRAGESRVASGDRKFKNHYELATHLLSGISTGMLPEAANSALGRVDVLYEFLTKIGFGDPKNLTPYLEQVHQDYQKRPISDQIIDQLLLEDDKRYSILEDAQRKSAVATGARRTDDDALANFLRAWIDVERIARQETATSNARHTHYLQYLNHLTGHMNPEMIEEFSRIRRMRNIVVHGIEDVSSDDLAYAEKVLRIIAEQIKAKKKRKKKL